MDWRTKEGYDWRYTEERRLNERNWEMRCSGRRNGSGVNVVRRESVDDRPD